MENSEETIHVDIEAYRVKVKSYEPSGPLLIELIPL